jgi:hypothetical protein
MASDGGFLSPFARDAIVIGGLAIAILQTWLAVRPISRAVKSGMDTSPARERAAQPELPKSGKIRKTFVESPVEIQMAQVALLMFVLSFVFSGLATVLEKTMPRLSLALVLPTMLCVMISAVFTVWSSQMLLKRFRVMESSEGRAWIIAIWTAWPFITLLSVTAVAVIKPNGPISVMIYFWAAIFLMATLVGVIEHVLRRYDLIL